MAAVVNALSLKRVVAVAVDRFGVILMLRGLMRLVIREDLIRENYVRCGADEGLCFRRECQCPSHKEVTTKEQVTAIRVSKSLVQAHESSLIAMRDQADSSLVIQIPSSLKASQRSCCCIFTLINPQTR